MIRGVFAPGERLVEDVLAKRHGVSRIPLREALRVLEVEGFIRVAPYYGTYVAELEDHEAMDLLELRGLLEPLAANRAAMRRTPEQLTRLSEVVRDGVAAVTNNELDKLPGLNTVLHETIADASGSSGLKQLLVQLRYKIAWLYSIELSRRAKSSWAEHKALVRAIEQQDADKARTLMVDHIRRAEAAYRLRQPEARAPAPPAV